MNKNFVIWEVDGVEYKLKLKTSRVAQLEKSLGTNLINIFMNGNMPTLTDMLTIVHGAIVDWNNSITRNDINDIYDKYLEEEGDITKLIADVLIPTLQVSGFLPKEAKIEK